MAHARGRHKRRPGGRVLRALPGLPSGHDHQPDRLQGVPGRRAGEPHAVRRRHGVLAGAAQRQPAGLGDGLRRRAPGLLGPRPRPAGGAPGGESARRRVLPRPGDAHLPAPVRHGHRPRRRPGAGAGDVPGDRGRDEPRPGAHGRGRRRPGRPGDVPRQPGAPAAGGGAGGAGADAEPVRGAAHGAGGAPLPGSGCAPGAGRPPAGGGRAGPQRLEHPGLALPGGARSGPAPAGGRALPPGVPRGLRAGPAEARAGRQPAAGDPLRRSPGRAHGRRAAGARFWPASSGRRGAAATTARAARSSRRCRICSSPPGPWVSAPA